VPWADRDPRISALPNAGFSCATEADDGSPVARLPRSVAHAGSRQLQPDVGQSTDQPWFRRATRSPSRLGSLRLLRIPARALRFRHHGLRAPGLFAYPTSVATLVGVDTDKIVEVCRRHGATFLALFGSTVRGDASPTSDVDLLVSFSAPKSLLDLVGIEREISETISRGVDLVTEGAVSPYLRESIQAELRVLYGSRP
jgi:predicted nucleotidyltransferase